MTELLDVAGLAARANALLRGEARALERPGNPVLPPLGTGAPSSPSGDYYWLGRNAGTQSRPARDALADVRADFPALHQQVNGRPLVWLDNGATTQKPRDVIDAISRFYERDNSNVHRGAHTLAARATDAYEGARTSVARLLGAASPEEVVFVRGTTEGMNLLASTLGRQRVGPGDEIVLTELEHHANIVPWQMLAQSVGARLRVVPLDDSGQVLLDRYADLLGPRTKVVSISHVSNALGTVLPVREMATIAHAAGIPVVVDGAQSVAHLPVDVVDLGADFYVFSGHKVFGPTGIGALYGRRDMLASLPPWQGGGSMIRDVTFERTTYNPPPQLFEAGTPSIADAVGLGAALEYLMRIGLDAVAAHEHRMADALMRELASVPGVRVVGTAPGKAAIASFVVEGLPTERVGQALDAAGVAVRAGHHCAQPALRRYGLESTVRASLALYNTEADVHALGAALRQLRSGRLR